MMQFAARRPRAENLQQPHVAAHGGICTSNPRNTFAKHAGIWRHLHVPTPEIPLRNTRQWVPPPSLPPGHGVQWVPPPSLPPGHGVQTHPARHVRTRTCCDNTGRPSPVAAAPPPPTEVDVVVVQKMKICFHLRVRGPRNPPPAAPHFSKLRSPCPRRATRRCAARLSPPTS